MYCKTKGSRWRRTAAEALAALQTSTAELITLDIHLGLTTCGLARNRRISDAAIIMVTGKDDAD
jgi:DNA-binding response OmpR family regulator